MNNIYDALWISDIQSVREQTTENFDRVVSVCQDACSENVGCEYDHFKLADDEESARNWGGSAGYETFEPAAERVLQSLFDVEAVLVHCHSGQNRSAAVCAAALGVFREERYEDAFESVRQARKIANPTYQMEGHARRFINERSD